MKNLACVVFEYDEREELELFLDKLETEFGSKIVTSRQFAKENTMVEDWREKLKLILNKLGITSSLKGYNTLFLLMEAFVDNPEYRKQFLMKQLYAYVTQKSGIPYSHIERRIRFIAKKIYQNHSKEYVNSILNIQDEDCSKMKLSEFIAILCQLVFDK